MKLNASAPRPTVCVFSAMGPMQNLFSVAQAIHILRRGQGVALPMLPATAAWRRAPMRPYGAGWCECGHAPQRSRRQLAGGPACAAPILARQDLAARPRNQMPCGGFGSRCSYWVKLRAGRGNSSVFRLHCGFSFSLNGAAPGKMLFFKFCGDAGNKPALQTAIARLREAVKSRHRSTIRFIQDLDPNFSRNRESANVGKRERQGRESKFTLVIAVRLFVVKFVFYNEFCLAGVHNFVSVIFCRRNPPAGRNHSRLQGHNN